MKKKVLIVAAHPDDEVLGCGGTILKHTSDGDDVKLVFMSDGETSRINGKDKIKERENKAKKAAAILKVNEIFFLKFPDNKMDTIPFLEIVKSIENIINQFKPEIIYTHFQGDLNIDHRITYEAVSTASRPFPGQSVKKLLCFEVLSSTNWNFSSHGNFNPNYFVDISNFHNLKYEALNSYDSEIRIYPHTRSLESIVSYDKYRGSLFGVNYGEAFILDRSFK